MKNVVIFIEGGVVQEVHSDSDNVNVVIIDRDVHDEDCKEVLDSKAYVYEWISPEINSPDLVKRVLEQVK